MDLAGNILQVNEGWTTTLGYKSASIVGKTLLDLVHPEDQHAFIRFLKKFNLPDHFGESQFRILDVNEKYHWFHWQCVSEGDTIFALIHDINHYKEIEEEYIYLNNLHNTILQTIDVGLIYARDSKFEWANSRFLSMFKTTMEEVKGKHLSLYLQE